MRLLGELGRRRLPGPDRPHRLVSDNESRVRLENRELATQDGLGRTVLALAVGLADAGDHAQAGLERCVRAPAGGLVGLPEVLPALRVPDDRSLDAQLLQRRRRNLPGERPLGLPVHVLRVHGPTALDRLAKRCERRTDDDVHICRRPKAGEKLARRARAFVHLPVRRDQHRPILRGFALPSCGERAFVAGESAKTVWYAVAANAAIAVAKGVAGAFTGSSALLAEAAHSVADTSNQGMLRVSLSLGERPPDEEHPFGYGKERFFWTLLASVVIFLAGAVFAIGHGTLRLINPPAKKESFPVVYATIAFAFVAEGISFWRAIQQTRKAVR